MIANEPLRRQAHMDSVTSVYLRERQVRVRQALMHLKMRLHVRERLTVYAEFSTRGIKNRKKYLGTARLISRFEQERGLKIYTDSFNPVMLDTFIDFLFETTPLRCVGDRKKYSTNSIIGHVRAISCMLKFAEKTGLRVERDSFAHCGLKGEEPTTVYLTTPEVQQLMDCQCLSRKERQVRDLFVIGCCTALRYSDYTNLTEANFINSRVSVLTSKTKKPVLIPYHEFISTILARNNYTYDFLSYRGSSVKFNWMIREICRKAGICNKVIISYMENHKRVEKVYEKWQRVGSHTARRSAATNMIRSGMTVPTVMRFTGHSTQTSFFRYLRFTLEENAMDCENNTFFRGDPEAVMTLLPQYPPEVPRWKSAF